MRNCSTKGEWGGVLVLAFCFAQIVRDLIIGNTQLGDFFYSCLGGAIISGVLALFFAFMGGMSANIAERLKKE